MDGDDHEDDLQMICVDVWRMMCEWKPKNLTMLNKIEADGGAERETLSNDVDQLIDWLIDWLMLSNWLIDVDWLIDWLID